MQLHRLMQLHRFTGAHRAEEFPLKRREFLIAGSLAGATLLRAEQLGARLLAVDGPDAGCRALALEEIAPPSGT